MSNKFRKDLTLMKFMELVKGFQTEEEVYEYACSFIGYVRNNRLDFTYSKIKTEDENTSSFLSEYSEDTCRNISKMASMIKDILALSKFYTDRTGNVIDSYIKNENVCITPNVLKLVNDFIEANKIENVNI